VDLKDDEAVTAADMAIAGQRPVKEKDSSDSDADSSSSAEDEPDVGVEEPQALVTSPTKLPHPSGHASNAWPSQGHGRDPGGSAAATGSGPGPTRTTGPHMRKKHRPGITEL
jgi:hypothetical protein